MVDLSIYFLFWHMECISRTASVLAAFCLTGSVYWTNVSLCRISRQCPCLLTVTASMRANITLGKDTKCELFSPCKSKLLLILYFDWNLKECIVTATAQAKVAKVLLISSNKRLALHRFGSQNHYCHSKMYWLRTPVVTRPLGVALIIIMMEFGDPWYYYHLKSGIDQLSESLNFSFTQGEFTLINSSPSLWGSIGGIFMEYTCTDDQGPSSRRISLCFNQWLWIWDLTQIQKLSKDLQCSVVVRDINLLANM